ncbi:CHAT domain-containing protein [Streptomyces achromogenes]
MTTSDDEFDVNQVWEDVLVLSSYAYQALKNRRDGLYEELVAALRTYAGQLPVRHPLRPRVLEQLGLLLGHAHGHRGDPAALTEGISVIAEAVRATPSEDLLGLAQRRLTHGILLHGLHQRTDDPAHLDAAVDELSRVVNGWPEDQGTSDDYRLARTRFLSALTELSRVHSTPAVAVRAVSLLRQALDAHPNDAVLHARHARWVFAAFFEHSCGNLGVDRAVDSVRSTTVDAAGGAEAYVWILHHAALVSRLRHETSAPQQAPGEGHTESLDEALSFMDTALSLVTDEQSRSTCRREQGAIRLGLYWATGRREYLDRAVDDLEYVIEAGALPSVHLADCLQQLGDSLMARSLRHRDKPSLAGAAAAWQRALRSRLAPRQRASVELSLRQVLEHLHRDGAEHAATDASPARRSRSALSETDVLRDAVLSTPLGGESLQRRVLALLASLWHRLMSSGDHTRDDLQDAVTTARWALHLVPEGHPERADTAGKAADVLYRSAVGRNRRIELAEAADLYRCAAREVGSGDAERRDHLKQFVMTLSQLGLATADASWLTKAVEATREILASARPGSADGAEAAGALAELLVRRFYYTGDSTDLDEATIMLHTWSTKGPADLRIKLLNKLALAQQARARLHDNSPFDTFLALRARQQALRLGSESGTGGTARRFPLAERLKLGIAGTDETLAALRSLLPAVSPESEDELGYLELLVTNLRSVLAEDTSYADALDDVIQAREFLLEHSKEPTHSAARASEQATLALHLHRRFERTGDPRDRDRAHALTREAADNSLVPPEIRLWCAQLLGTWSAAEGDWPRAARAFRDAVGRLPHVLPRQVPREDLERGLANTHGLTAAAAAAALHCGDPSGALEALEQGRALLHTYAMQTRLELVSVATIDPRLAEDMRSVGERLGNATWNTPFSADSLSADERHRLAHRWDELVREARGLPGCAELFTPPRTSALLTSRAETSAGEAVVVPFVSPSRCEALVIRAGTLSTVPLPDLAEDALRERVIEFRETLPFANLNPQHEPSQVMAQAPLREVLEWLWHVVAGPVLDHLGFTDAPTVGRSRPRLWWVPTGMFSFLPLHAAGVSGAPGQSVLDRVVSSYSVTVRALRNAQRRPQPPAALGTGPRLLAIGTVGPDTASEVLSTPRMLRETREVAAHFHDAVVLEESEATVDAVTAALRYRSWAHFACHGRSSPHQPSASHLQLHDGVLDFARLTRQRLPDAEVAYLSACETASGGWVLADEGITLAAACQLAGFRHAVASMWEVLDSTSAETARLFYRHVAAQGDRRDPATALHHAQLILRNRHPLLPTRWAPYVHVGP